MRTNASTLNKAQINLFVQILIIIFMVSDIEKDISTPAF